jgi:aspartyl-tRNA synthetase
VFVKFAGPARTKVGEELNLIAKDRFELCWIVDFPMYEWNEEEKKIDFSHNPFSMPNMPAADFLKLDPDDRDIILGIKAIQYDIVCNGIELSSGAIRNHRPDVMKKAFAIAAMARTCWSRSSAACCMRCRSGHRAWWHCARRRPHRDADRR